MILSTILLALNLVLNIIIVYIKYIQYKKEQKLEIIEQKIENLTLKKKIGLVILAIIAGAIPFLFFILGLLFDFIPKIKISIESNKTKQEIDMYCKKEINKIDFDFKQPESDNDNNYL